MKKVVRNVEEVYLQNPQEHPDIPDDLAPLLPQFKLAGE
jgi:hypothetical protein